MPFALKYHLNKLYWLIVKPPRRLYRFLFRPPFRAVKVMIFHDGKLLLVRNTYDHRKWAVPGGGCDADETTADAAVREAFEETGIRFSTVTLIGSYEEVRENCRGVFDVYTATADSPDVAVDGFEVREAGWFMLDVLPEDRATRVDALVALHVGAV